MSELREAAEEALRWMEHARLHLTIKERMHPDGLGLYDSAAEALRAALAQPETDAGVSWDGHNVRGDADSIAEVRRLIEFEDARQGTKPATVEDIRIYDAIAANYVNAQPEAEAEPVAWQVKKGDDMNTLREAAQAARHAEVRAQHKEFARWFLELSDKSALASEYLAWLAWKAALAHPPRYVGDARKHVVCICPDCVAANYRGWRDVTPPTEGKP